MSTAAAPDNVIVHKNDAPLTFARAYLKFKCRRESDEALMLLHWRSDFFRWANGVYEPVVPEELKADLWAYLDGQRVIGRDRRQTTFRPRPRDVSAVMDALAAECQVFKPQMPAWLDGHRPDPADVIAFRNGLLDVRAHLRDGRSLLIPPTPLWFSTTVLPYEFTSEASCPKWEAFLHDVFDGDAELVALLQQWFGYCLTADTSQQKMMLVVGPPRSGKGTITRMLERLVGQQNTANPSLSSLGERFGLTTLLNKTVAICSDAHLGREKDTTGILETLKNLVGEDSRDIDRKGRDPLSSVRLYSRFTICCNELPRMTDASAAMVPRLLVLPMHKTFVGREDRSLDAKLATETPGVLLWALEGLRTLRECGKFIEPEASVAEIKEFERLSSPVKAFIEDWCDLGPSKSVVKEHLYATYKRYCEKAGMKAMAQNTFGAKLHAALPGLSRSRPRQGEQRVNLYDGIDIKLEHAGPPE